jgi:hypothetical protein
MATKVLWKVNSCHKSLVFSLFLYCEESMGCGYLVDKLRWIINFFNIERVRQYLICIILNYFNVVYYPESSSFHKWDWQYPPYLLIVNYLHIGFIRQISVHSFGMPPQSMKYICRYHIPNTSI